MGTYLLIDPFASNVSGVTTYTKLAAERLCRIGIPIEVIQRKEGEELEPFRCRVAEFVKAHAHIEWIEAPETLASTAYIPDGPKIHIRLHCSRSLGAMLQGLQVRRDEVAAEQREISRARLLSAPSMAAVVGARLLFKLPSHTVVYPNPLPSLGCRDIGEPRPYDVLYVGRMESLKGYATVGAMALRLPHRKFLVATTPEAARSPHKFPANVTVSSVEALGKARCFGLAKVTVIPSLYETASMVGLESLAAQTPVVTWEHLGVAEYYSQPWVTRVACGSLRGMAGAIERLCSGSRGMQAFPDIPAHINNCFDGSMMSLLQGQTSPDSGLVAPTRRLGVIIGRLAVSEKCRRSLAMSKSPFSRKLAKLRRDPRAFFRDARVIRGFYKPAVKKPPRRANTSSDGEHVSREPSNFGNIAVHDRIEFGVPPEKPVGTITALFYPRDETSRHEALLDALASFDDFKYTRLPALQVGTFERELAETSALGILNRIDRSNKERIGALDFIVLVDPPAPLVEALRCCSPRPRVIVVRLSESHQMPDRFHTDVLIRLSGQAHPPSNFRRVIEVGSVDHIHFAIRKAIQDGIPKDVDLLLAVKGFHDMRRDEFLEFRKENYQGILELEGAAAPMVRTMSALCELVAKSTTGLALLESIYMRYKSLIEEESGEALADLIAYCLYDGVLLEVRFK